MCHVTSEPCGDVSKRQATVRVALSVGLTNGHLSVLLGQIFSQRWGWADATFPTMLSQGNYQQIEFLEDVGGEMVIKGWDGSGMLGVLL